MLTGCALLFMLTLGGVSCDEEEGYRTGVPTEPPAQELVLGLEISSLTAAAGDSLTLAVSVPAELDRALGAVLGRLHLDTAKLQLIGEVVADSVTIVSVNPRTLNDGYLRLFAVSPRGLNQRLVVLGFEVTGAGYEAGLSFTAEQVWDSAGKKLEPPIVAPGVSLATDLPPASAARAEADERIELTGPKPTGPLYPRLLGDALVDQDIDRFDSRRVSDIVSGKSPMPPAGSDDFYSADVTRDTVIDGDDAMFLSEYVAGVPVPQPVGEPIRRVLPFPDLEIDFDALVMRNEIKIGFNEGVGEERALFLVDSIAASLGGFFDVFVGNFITHYTVRWPHDPQIDARQVAEQVEALPEVDLAYQGGFVTPGHRAPNDGGWDGYPQGPHAQEIFWHWGGDRQTTGSNWAWKAVDLPLAWSCQDSSDVRVGIVDIAFTGDSTVLHNDLTRGRVRFHYELPDTGRIPRRLTRVAGPAAEPEPFEHGLRVAGVLGANGNNQLGLTGVVWGGAAEIALYQAPFTAQPFPAPLPSRALVVELLEP
jgi:hypothetical protein